LVRRTVNTSQPALDLDPDVVEPDAGEVGVWGRAKDDQLYSTVGGVPDDELRHSDYRV
jgi:hypothetical protein